MGKIKLLVGLKIPDTTAITAFHTLEGIGYKELKKLGREEYYEFSVTGNEEGFMKNIVKVDILVNANKNYSKIFKEGNEEKIENTEKGIFIIKVIVKDTGNMFLGLLNSLRNMGFNNLTAVSKAILWSMHISAKTEEEAKQAAKKITENLLYNENYQEYKVL
jgi:phosphoribosylformylglycinamidine (FGAM) synthase PurS component